MTTRNVGEPGPLQTTSTAPDVKAPNVTALYGAVLTGTGVAFGAFGAHALKTALSPALLEVFETGVRYQMYHGLGLLALGALPTFQGPGRGRAPALLLAGTVIFSGSLYLLSFSNLRWLGAVTPVGGVLMLAGWGVAAWQLWKGGRSAT